MAQVFIKTLTFYVGHFPVIGKHHAMPTSGHTKTYVTGVGILMVEPPNSAEGQKLSRYLPGPRTWPTPTPCTLHSVHC